MALVSLDTVKGHLRVDGTADDALIGLYLTSAEASISGYLERAVYPTQEALNAAADPSGLVAGAAIQHAVLLLVGEAYRDREGAAKAPQIAGEMPPSVARLLAPLRNGAGV